MAPMNSKSYHQTQLLTSLLLSPSLLLCTLCSPSFFAGNLAGLLLKGFYG